VKKEIENLKKRPPPEQIKSIIRQLCSLHPLKLSEIASVLGRHPKYVRENYLTAMVESGELEYKFPKNPAHPQQAYTEKK
jgi:ATP-dependent DNA helicase RecG